jgi:hypothetical protein
LNPAELRQSDYLYVEALSRCEIDLPVMGATLEQDSPSYGAVKVKLPEVDRAFGIRFALRIETGDGSDLFISRLFPGKVFCSRRVYDLGLESQWTNFRFIRPEDGV